MRFLIVILFAACFNYNTQASDTEKLARQRLELIALKKADSLKTYLESTEDYTSYEIEFKCDTFIVNEIIRLEMHINYSTSAMNKTIYDAVDHYEKLISKYYDSLYKSLNDEDKKVLEESQSIWNEFVKKESKLTYRMERIEYSGGGTIQSNFSSSTILELFEQRLLMLYFHQRGKLYN